MSYYFFFHLYIIAQRPTSKWEVDTLRLLACIIILTSFSSSCVHVLHRMRMARLVSVCLSVRESVSESVHLYSSRVTVCLELCSYRQRNAYSCQYFTLIPCDANIAPVNVISLMSDANVLTNFWKWWKRVLSILDTESQFGTDAHYACSTFRECLNYY